MGVMSSQEVAANRVKASNNALCPSHVWNNHPNVCIYASPTWSFWDVLQAPNCPYLSRGRPTGLRLLSSVRDRVAASTQVQALFFKLSDRLYFHLPFLADKQITQKRPVSHWLVLGWWW